jgi:hypothetical protein
MVGNPLPTSFNRGMSLEAIAAMLGHRSLDMTLEQLLPDAVNDARDQELTWTQIGELLNTTAATAARRYRNKP